MRTPLRTAPTEPNTYVLCSDVYAQKENLVSRCPGRRPDSFSKGSLNPRGLAEYLIELEPGGSHKYSN